MNFCFRKEITVFRKAPFILFLFIFYTQHYSIDNFFSFYWLIVLHFFNFFYNIAKFQSLRYFFQIFFLLLLSLSIHCRDLSLTWTAWSLHDDGLHATETDQTWKSNMVFLPIRALSQVAAERKQTPYNINPTCFSLSCIPHNPLHRLYAYAQDTHTQTHTSRMRRC